MICSPVNNACFLVSGVFFSDYLGCRCYEQLVHVFSAETNWCDAGHGKIEGPNYFAGDGINAMYLGEKVEPYVVVSLPHSAWQEKLACQTIFSLERHACHLMKIRLGMPDKRVGLTGVWQSSGMQNRHQSPALPSRRIFCDLSLKIFLVYYNRLL